ncbi:hypothetical protein GXP67_36330 [Rhodocytophaga rosea]|uniref:Uncharacterized protein n=1 Tax=Rhodocytophaga rosea TaxID=2704465 RepID=A0A6C0GV54_9BACT|nr:hypothetical protein [Rhodocytophaga rosea]QHT71747.1 hypothetical protein GXP67_36330 [Rhodocytophaga rosea]
MDEILEIPVDYKGEHLCFKAKILSYSYSYKIVVDVSGRQMMYEADEEGKYRAVAELEALQKGEKIDIGLLEAIALVLDDQVMK